MKTLHYSLPLHIRTNISISDVFQSPISFLSVRLNEIAYVQLFATVPRFLLSLFSIDWFFAFFLTILQMFLTSSGSKSPPDVLSIHPLLYQFDHNHNALCDFTCVEPPPYFNSTDYLHAYRKQAYISNNIFGRDLGSWWPRVIIFDSFTHVFKWGPEERPTLDNTGPHIYIIYIYAYACACAYA